MYLSQLILDLGSFTTRRMLFNPYSLHQAICRAFPDATDGGTGRVLYRLDEGGPEERASLLVQSERQPDWQKAEWLSGCVVEPPKTKPYAPQPVRGQVLYFRLRANPTVKKSDGKRSRRLGLLREEDQLKWFHHKAADCGFTILSCTAIREGIEKSEKLTTGEAGHMSFLAVRLEGVLRVEEPDVFVDSLRIGIGSGKGMGFGLLSVAPIRN
jgi:CRISPR system Cascade subunit CasE